MKEKILLAMIDLIKVKSIITILTFLAFFYLSISGKIGIDNFMLIIGMIATYFFNKDSSEKKMEKENDVLTYEMVEDE